MKYAIIGDPVTHSLSPQMHTAGFKAAGIDAEYNRIHVPKSDLKTGIEFLKENHYSGWNVTYPLKEEIIPLLDIVSPPALQIGAVNTVKVVKGLLHGYNTDGEGFWQSLSDKGFILNQKKVVILGAGGAAKAIAVVLAEKQVDMLILNRDQGKARGLAEHVGRLGGSAAWGTLTAGTWLQEVDLLIQTTPVGMKGESLPFDLHGIRPSCWAVDLIYAPAITPFLRKAKQQGCETMNGLEMLLYQGVLAWKYWFNRQAPIAVMRRALLEKQRSSDKSEGVGVSE